MRTGRALAAGLLMTLAGACRGCGREEGAPRPAARADVRLRLRTESEGGWLVSWDDRRPFALTVPPGKAALSTLASAVARTHPPASTVLVLEVQADIGEAAVEPVAAALRRGGFASVTVVRH